MGFTDQFTNVLISPVNKRYRLITLTGNVELVWPIESATSDNTLLEWMDVTEDADGYVITFPDATEGAQGFSSIIVNTGAHSFTVNDNTGSVIQVIAAGAAWLIWLKDNSTVAGSWQALQLGSTTSQASAAVLAGQGLKVIGLTLNQSHPVWNISGDYTVVTSIDRARLLLWTGGAGTINFPTSVSMGDDWFTLVANQGSASLTLDPAGSELIDGASTKTLAIGESCFVITNGTNLYTVGYGRSVAYTETYLNLNVAGSADITLTSPQFSSNIIRFFGVLTGDINVMVPAAVHTFIVFNDTTGAHSITVKVSGQTGVVAQQANKQLLYCNGTDVFFGNTINTIATGLFDNGTVTTPSISFTSDTDTGLFRANPNTIGVAAGGVLSALFNTASAGVNALTFTPGATGVATTLGSYSGTDTDVGITITPQGAGGITLSAATAVASTLGVTGNFSVATNKFTVAASSGNTLIAGTLGVTGAATAASFNKLVLTAPATGSTLTIADGKTATISNTLTFTGTDSSSVAFGAGGTVLYGNQSITLSGDVTGTGSTAITTTVAKIAGTVVSGTTGTTNAVFSNTPTLVSPLLGTPTSGLLTNCTGYPVASLVNLGAGIATFLTTPSSANLATAVTDETGSGALVFANSPTLVTAILGSSTATTQAAGDNSTKLATTSYADQATALAVGAYFLGTNNSGGTLAANATTAGSNVIVSTAGGSATTDSVSGTVKTMQRLTNGQTGLWQRSA